MTLLNSLRVQLTCYGYLFLDYHNLFCRCKGCQDSHLSHVQALGCVAEREGRAVYLLRCGESSKPVLSKDKETYIPIVQPVYAKLQKKGGIVGLLSYLVVATTKSRIPRLRDYPLHYQ